MPWACYWRPNLLLIGCCPETGRAPAYKQRELREMLALTQSDVAETLEIGQKRVSEMERGQVDRTKVDTRRRYADALGDTLRVETQIGDETNKIARSSGSKDRPGDWSIVPA